MVTGAGCVATGAEWEGNAAPADSNKFIASATTAIAVHCAAIHLIPRTILDITPTPQFPWLTVEA
jgi:hypothetical protein